MSSAVNTKPYNHVVQIMPRRSISQAIGLEGERWFAAQLPSSWISQLPTSDIGVDLLVVVCDEGPLNGLEFRVQVKSAGRWSRQRNRVVVPGFRRDSLIDLLRGVTPTLLVLYEASTTSGWCYWLNQLVAASPSLLRSLHQTVTLKVPERPVDQFLWPQIGRELLAIERAVGRRIVVAGHAVPVLEATRHLMQSLHLIDLCANGSGTKPVPFDDLLNAEMTAHREIVTTLLHLQQALAELGEPILGLDEMAERYVSLCEPFLPGFGAYARQSSTAGLVFQVNAELMAQCRPQAVRFVNQVVWRLTELTLGSLRHGAAG